MSEPRVPVTVIDDQGVREGILTADDKGDLITPLQSWATEVIADSSGNWAGNGLRFATQEEAELYVKDLMRRWTLVTDTRTVPSPDEVNAEIVDGVMRHLR